MNVFLLLLEGLGFKRKKRPVERVTGSHKRSCLFGAISFEDKNSSSDSTLNSTAIPSLISEDHPYKIFNNMSDEDKIMIVSINSYWRKDNNGMRT